MITVERLKELLAYDLDTGVFTWLQNRGGGVRAGDLAGHINEGYVVIRVDGRKYKAHILAWFYTYGVWPLGEIDHTNESRHDNRMSNLRDTTHSQNQHNRSKPRLDNTSGYLGVSYHRATNKWVAQICSNGKKRHLGLFDAPEQASEAYLAAKAAIHPFWAGNQP